MPSARVAARLGSGAAPDVDMELEALPDAAATMPAESEANLDSQAEAARDAPAVNSSEQVQPHSFTTMPLLPSQNVVRSSCRRQRVQRHTGTCMGSPSLRRPRGLVGKVLMTRTGCTQALSTSDCSDF